MMIPWEAGVSIIKDGVVSIEKAPVTELMQSVMLGHDWVNVKVIPL